MKVLLIVGCLIGGCLSLNIARSGSRSRSNSDPCATSPCAKDALCERSATGLAFCRCRPEHTGDPFVQCNSNENSQQSTTRQTNIKIVPDHEIAQAQNPTRFNVEYHTSTETVKSPDISRIPITQNYRDHQSQPILHETVVHTHIKKQPSMNHPLSSQFHLNNDHYRPADIGGQKPMFPPDSSVSDPLGQYSNCRTIRGVIVCADNSVDDAVPQQSQNNGEISPNVIVQLPHMNRNPTIQYHDKTQIPQMHDQQQNQKFMNKDDNNCKSMCGVNAICRMVIGRLVCGCPEHTTGDPSVRCDPLNKEETSTGCKKHNECSSTEICVKEKCVDPCNPKTVTSPQVMITGGDEFSSCGKNANCVVIQHTPLCACNKNFYGNPYVECVANLHYN